MGPHGFNFVFKVNIVGPSSVVARRVRGDVLLFDCTT